jgi:hypothetical protein
MSETKKIYKWTSQVMKPIGAHDYRDANTLSADGWTMKQTEVRYDERQGFLCCYTLWEKEVSE